MYAPEMKMAASHMIYGNTTLQVILGLRNATLPTSRMNHTMTTTLLLGKIQQHL